LTTPFSSQEASLATAAPPRSTGARLSLQRKPILEQAFRFTWLGLVAAKEQLPVFVNPLPVETESE
jgi:hypothetical protein